MRDDGRRGSARDPRSESAFARRQSSGCRPLRLFPLAAAGQAGVEQALSLMRAEIERDMKLMGCSSVSQLSRANLRYR